MISSMISMSPNNAGFVQLPVPHASTVASALLKHCRLLEDGLSKGGLDVLTTVTILFSKPGSSGHDKRKTSQLALFLTPSRTGSDNPWLLSKAWTSQALGPVPLIKVSDMLGYDADLRPSSGARVEQRHVRQIVCLL